MLPGNNWKKLGPAIVLLTLAVGCGGGTAPAPAPAAKSAPPAAAPPAATTAPAAPAPKPAAAAATAAAPAPAAAKPATQTKVTFAYPSDSLIYAGVLLAHKKGYFADEGIDLEFVKTGAGNKVISALAGGSAQFGTTEYYDVYAAAEQRQGILGFAALTIESPQAVVVKKKVLEQKGITKATPVDKKTEALRGLKVAVTGAGAGTDVMVRYLAKRGKIDPERELTIVPAGSTANIIAAFSQSQVDAFCTVSPGVELGVSRGDGEVMIDTRAGEVPEVKGRVSFGLYATKEYIEKNPETVTRITKALWRGLKLIAENRADAKEQMKSLLLGGDIDQQTYDQMWETNTHVFPKTPALGEKEIQINQVIRNAAVERQTNIPFAEAATNRYVDEAKKALGY
ncbi:MAG: ABC transporter substrate-binding protein [Chloroflexi bacterium]|nr:ABC transporter substrate-binding protein [Chloroflexota bacterium]